MEETRFVLIQDDEDCEATSGAKLYCKKICKGYGCCQACGCVLAPSDLYVYQHDFTHEERVRYLIHLLKRGDYSIDHKRFHDKAYGAFCVTGNPYDRRSYKVDPAKLKAGKGVLYLRARNKNKKIVDIIHFNGEADGPCAAWNMENGCKFSYSKRPKGGRMLIPCLVLGVPDCIERYDEQDAAGEWKEYWEDLYEVFLYFFKRDL